MNDEGLANAGPSRMIGGRDRSVRARRPAFVAHGPAISLRLLGSRPAIPSEVRPMRRIGLAALLAVSIALAPLAAQGQPAERVYRVAVVHPSTPVTELAAATNPHYAVFFSELRELGYVEGKNLIVERR